ncbi:hypothetical protein GGI24_002617 [Coemansia furcata]|nr:hypothetical protein GGI24_002617 [Coemansia furcata]
MTCQPTATNPQEVVTIESFKELYTFLLASPGTIVMVARKKRVYNDVARIISSVLGNEYKLVQIHTGKYDFPGIHQDWYLMKDDEVFVLFYNGLRWIKDINESYVKEIRTQIESTMNCDVYTGLQSDTKLVTDDLPLDVPHKRNAGRKNLKSKQK